MTRLSPARCAALELASTCRRKGLRMRDFLRDARRMDSLGEKDRALATRLLLGSVAAVGELDRAVASHLSTTTHLEPKVRDALRLATFEILYLRTPPRAAVSQGVEMVRAASPRAAGLANALLRHIAEEDRPRVDDARARLCSCEQTLPPTEAYARVSGYPVYLCEQLIASMGSCAAAGMLLQALEAPPVYVALREDIPEEVVAPFDAHPSVAPRSFMLGAPAGLSATGLVAQAEVFPADISSQVIALLAPSEDGSRILEIGQGRGTKSVLLLQNALRCGNDVQLVSVELDPKKSAVSQERLKRAGLAKKAACLTFDATRLADDALPQCLQETFDTVFIDAPCSGAGTMRRHPEISWSLEKGAVAAGGTLPQLQLRLLKAAAGKVASHGVLSYATCSPLASEDEEVIKAFLATKEGSCFTVENIEQTPAVKLLTDRGKEMVAHATMKDGFLQLGRTWEYIDADQHFLAKLRRTS